MSAPGQDMQADAHLRTALRHAPDADIGAPAHLSAQIIAAGHRAAAEAVAPARHRPRFWQTPWTLRGSGAFATLLLAGFLGVLWRGENPGPAREAAPVAAAPAPAPPLPASSALRSFADTTVVVQAPPAAPSPVTPPSPAVAPRARAADTAVQGGIGAMPNPRQVVTAAAPAPTMQARQETPQPAPVTEADAMYKPSPMPSSPAAAAAVAAAVAAAPPAPTAVVAQAAAQAAPTAVAAPVLAERARAAQVTRQALAAGSDDLAGAMRVAPRPEAPWMAALAEGPAVQWRLDGANRPAPSSWLYALAAQAQGRWAPSSTQAAADERSLWWQRLDVVQGRVWLNAERVLFCDAQGRCQAAVLPPDVARELLKNMPR